MLEVARSEPAPVEPAPASAPPRAPWPPSALPLALLATLAGPDGEGSRATIRDTKTGVIASYRVGDRIRDAVEVLSIEDGVVELSRDGEVEYLSISEIPVELSADDVFYPDLVDDLTLSGSMADGVRMPEGLEYIIKTPGHAWGTPRTVARLRDAIRDYARTVSGEPKVHVGDLSRRGGGPFPPHLSHQTGRDVDVGYVLRGAVAHKSRFLSAHEGNLDVARTWALLQALLRTQAVRYVFVDYDIQRLLHDHALQAGEDPRRVAETFQYPRGRRASHGLLRHWKGHRNHFHVRFHE